VKAKTVVAIAAIVVGLIFLARRTIQAAKGVMLELGRNDVTYLGEDTAAEVLFAEVRQYIPIVWMTDEHGNAVGFKPHDKAYGGIVITKGMGLSIEASQQCFLAGEWKYSWPNVYPTR